MNKLTNNYWVEDILETLSKVSPFFARTLLEQAVKKINKTFETVTAAELFEIIKSEINPSLSKNSKYGMNPFLTAHTAIFECTKDNEIVRMNESGRALVHKLCTIHMTAPDAASVYQLLYSLGFICRVNEITDISLEVRRFEIPLDKSSFLHTFNIVLIPIFDKNKVITGIISIAQNHSLVTALHKEITQTNKNLEIEIKNRMRIEKDLIDNQAKLVNSSKMASLGEMAGGIAHEINNPLSVITLRCHHIRHLLMSKDQNFYSFRISRRYRGNCTPHFYNSTRHAEFFKKHG